MNPGGGGKQTSADTHPRGQAASHRIEMVPLSWLILRLDPANEKSHDLPDIKASIRQYGFTVPALLDERTGLIGAGHGRVEALAEMWEDDEDPPRRIGRESLSGGEWLVPLLRDGLDTRDDMDASAYRILDNRLTEKGGWVLESLTSSLEALRQANRLEGTGFTAPDLDALIASIPRSDEPTSAPDQSAKLITRRSVLVDVADDASQRKLIDRLTKEGLKCRALNS